LPTVSVDTKISLSTQDARTVLTGFEKAIAAESVTTKTLVLAGGASGTLNLALSDFLIITGLLDVLTVTLSTSTGSQVFENVGFLMVHTSNLSAVTILNTSSDEQSINLIF